MRFTCAKRRILLAGKLLSFRGAEGDFTGQPPRRSQQNATLSVWRDPDYSSIRLPIVNIILFFFQFVNNNFKAILPGYDSTDAPSDFSGFKGQSGFADKIRNFDHLNS